MSARGCNFRLDRSDSVDHPLHSPNLQNLWLIGVVVASPHIHSEVPDTILPASIIQIHAPLSLLLSFEGMMILLSE